MTEAAAGVTQESAELARARVLVDFLHQALRALQLYPRASPVPGEFKKKLFDELAGFLSERGALTLRAEGGAFLHDGQPVRKDAGVQDTLAAALSRDGIRTLSFLPGLRFAELELFLDIIRKGLSADGNDDLSTLLWEAPLDRIAYTTARRGSQGDSPALARRSRARAAQTPGTGASPGSPDVVEKESHAEQDAGAAAGGAALLDADLARLPGDEAQAEEYRREASSFDYEGTLTSILLDILACEEEPSGFGEACILVEDAYDRFISAADFDSARRLAEGIAGLDAAPGPRPGDCAAQLKKSCLRAAGRASIELLCRALNEHPDCDLEACRRLLTGLPGDLIPRLFEALAVLENYPARMMVCDLLVSLGAERIEAVGDGLLDERWFVARNAAMVLGRIGGPLACPGLERASKHRGEAVRREAVAALTRIEGADSSRLLRGMLGDASRDLRLQALVELSARRDAFTGLLVEKKVQEPGFLRVDGEEQRRWLSALTRIKGDEALPVFRGLIDRWVVFNRSAAGRLRLRAVTALAEGDGPQTAAYLAELSRARSRRVREAAEYSAVKVRNHGGRA